MSNEILKPYEICDEAVSAGIKKANYSLMQVIILGILAGVFISLGGFGAALASHNVADVGVAKLIAGIVFPVGLMLVLICGADLFTGNCLMVVALAEKKISFKAMIKNWVIVYLTNFVGAFVFAFLIFNTGILHTNADKLGGYAIKVASNKANLTFMQAFCSGILANFVVCLAVWGSYATKDMVGKIAIIFFPIMVFVIGGFEHCIANMYYFSIGMMAKTNELFIETSHLTPDKVASLNLHNIIFNNLIASTLGNIVGGSIFVGLAYWAVFKRKKVNSKVSHNEAA
jgi:formate/nitrite transporter